MYFSLRLYALTERVRPYVINGALHVLLSLSANVRVLSLRRQLNTKSQPWCFGSPKVPGLRNTSLCKMSFIVLWPRKQHPQMLSRHPVFVRRPSANKQRCSAPTERSLPTTHVRQQKLQFCVRTMQTTALNTVAFTSRQAGSQSQDDIPPDRDGGATEKHILDSPCSFLNRGLCGDFVEQLSLIRLA